MANKYYDEIFVNRTAQAIKRKRPELNQFKISDFETLIDGIKTGDAEEKDVDFYDYDGTRLYSYTLAEIQEMTALPRLPVHEGLTNQGWNWTLEQIKDMKSPLIVGCNYITDDGKTRLHITIPENNYTAYLRFRTTVASTAKIYWGDETSPTDSAAEITYQVYTHEYSSAGDYIIEIELTDDDQSQMPSQLQLGYDISSNVATYRTVMGHPDVNADVYDPTKDILTEINLGKRATLVRAFAHHMNGLKYISLPTTFVFPSSYIFRESWMTFYGASALEALILPANLIGDDGNYADLFKLKVISPGYGGRYGDETNFSTCRTITKKFMWSGNNGINCGRYGISTLIVTDNVSSMSRLISPGYINNPIDIWLLKQTQVIPWNSSSSYFNATIVRKIYIPASLYDEWVETSGWSDYADRFVAVEV